MAKKSSIEKNNRRRKLAARYEQVTDQAQDRMQDALAEYDATMAQAAAARDLSLDDAATARAEAVRAAEQKYDDHMRAELGLSVRLVESGGVLRVVDDKTQVVIASATPNHGDHYRVNGPNGEITMVPAARAREALWEALRPAPVPA